MKAVTFLTAKIHYENICNIQQLLLEPEWVMSQWPVTQKVKCAIESEAMRVRGIIVLVKYNKLVQKNIMLIRNFGKTQFNRHRFGFQSQCFLLLVGCNI